jgi:hypothetical protein
MDTVDEIVNVITILFANKQYVFIYISECCFDKKDTSLFINFVNKLNREGVLCLSLLLQKFNFLSEKLKKKTKKNMATHTCASQTRGVLTEPCLWTN